MTAAVSLRDLLSEPGLRRDIAKFVRRRVPPGEVDDIAQTVLCDALASPAMPDDPKAVPRFVHGIARHKVIDFHRRERWIAREAELPETSAPPAPVEDRALLLRVAESATASPRERETFQWLLREHDGEPLAEIAERAGVAPATVRQRVSRLRRSLRSRWAHLLALLVVAGSGGMLAHRTHEGSPGAIMADPMGAPANQMLALSQGRWRLESVTADREVPLAERSALLVEARSATVHIDGSRLEIHTTARNLARVVALSPRGEGTFEIAIHGGERVERGVARLEGGALLLSLDGYRARLVRD